MKDKYGFNIDKHITAKEAKNRSTATLDDEYFVDLYLRRFVYNKIFDDINTETICGGRSVIITEMFDDDFLVLSSGSVLFNDINRINKNIYFSLFTNYFEELGYSVKIEFLINGPESNKIYLFEVSW